MSHSSPAPVSARIASGVIGVAFGGIGLVVLAFMWGLLGDDDFARPPLFFRLFASLIALPFVAVGGAALFAAITGNTSGGGKGALIEGTATQARGTLPDTSGSFQCPHCSSPLADRAEVSPHGDAKCGHCGSWFNVHGR
jgi:hypothetical protein